MEKTRKTEQRGQVGLTKLVQSKTLAYILRPRKKVIQLMSLCVLEAKVWLFFFLAFFIPSLSQFQWPIHCWSCKNSAPESQVKCQPAKVQRALPSGNFDERCTAKLNHVSIEKLIQPLNSPLARLLFCICRRQFLLPLNQFLHFQVNEVYNFIFTYTDKEKEKERVSLVHPFACVSSVSCMCLHFNAELCSLSVLLPLYTPSAIVVHLELAKFHQLLSLSLSLPFNISLSSLLPTNQSTYFFSLSLLQFLHPLALFLVKGTQKVSE